MCLLLREALAIGKIAIAPALVTSEMAHKEAVLRIQDELSSYCVVTEAPKTTFGKVRARPPPPAPALADHAAVCVKI